MPEKPKIICVDDEANVLSAFKRQLYKQFDLTLSTDGYEALELMEKNGPFAVVLSDMRMPNIDGAAFLSKAKKVAPHTARIMLTGNNDQQTAALAVNDGEVFRFLNKPCPNDKLAEAIHAGVEHYRLMKLEHDLLNKTLLGSIQVMFDILSMINPVAFAQTVRVKEHVLELGRTLNVSNLWELKVATMLSQIGCMTIPTSVLEKQQSGNALSKEEQAMLNSHYEVTEKLLQHIPRLESVAKIIALLNSKLDLKKVVPETPIYFSAGIIQIAQDYDLLMFRGDDYTTALNKLKEKSAEYSPLLLEAIHCLKPKVDPGSVVTVAFKELKPDMILAEDVKNEQGMLLVPKDYKLNEAICRRLINHCDQGEISASEIKVIVPSTAKT